jgi:cytoskeletal protein RodZ
MPSLGDAFRAAREARHLSLSDVSEQIHIRSVYLQSIEDEDWRSIGAPVYVRGFVRTYARFLGLDSEEAVEHYNELLGDRPGGLAGPFGRGSPRPAPGPSIWVWLAGAAALALVGFVAYNYIQFQQSNGATARLAKPTLAPTAAPISQATLAPIVATPTPNPVASLGTASGGTLVIRVHQDSWLQVSVDGVQQVSTILPAGTEKVYHGKTASIRVGNAGGVDVSVNGKNVGSLGAAGDVVERSFTLVEK